MLQLRTFGGLSVHEDGAPCRGAAVRRKTLALLALLAAADKNGASRDKLIAFLWPESDTEHGRNLLRQACFALRRDLHQPELILGATELRLNPEAVSSDVHAFADALERGDLAGAVALYGGPFLDGFYLRGADEFERWAETERGRLAKQVCAVLEALATQALAGADHRAAEQWWHRLAALDPLSSHAALGLMTALAAGGDRAGAIRHARVHEAMLRRELGTAPEAAVTRLAERLRAEAAPPESSEAAPALAGHTVGREAERGELRAGLASALAGRSVMLCVSGEPGIGKTTLVESFLGEVAASDRLCWIARGRCSERLAGAEAYLPFLEALEGLTHSDPRASAARLMQDVAPNWYAQVAPLSPEGSPRGELQAASQERLKRELSAFLLELARLRPLIVFFDDLHWADASTVDLLGHVTQRLAASQTLVVVTFRPTELLLAKHPFASLKRDLQGRGLCRDVPMELLAREDVEEYLALEFPGHDFPPMLAALLHAKTEGNPLFMTDLLRYLRGRQIIKEHHGRWVLAAPAPDLERQLPESARAMIQRKIEYLAQGDRRLLAAASVQGYEFDSTVVATVLKQDSADVEERLAELEQVHDFVRSLGEQEFPDGTLTVRCRFAHVLYQNALHASLTPTRRAALSAAVAEALLGHYGSRSDAVAGEVAVLFEAARQPEKAVQYFQLAAQRAAQVFAHQEAVVLAERGLALLATLPETPERAVWELGLQLTSGFSLSVTKGYADPASGRSMARAREVCRQLGEPAELFSAIYGLWGFYLVASELKASREMAEQLVRIAEAAANPILLFGAHTVLGSSLVHMGELALGHEHLERGIALYDPEQRSSYRAVYQQDIGVYVRCESVRLLWLLGYPARATRRMAETLALANQVSDPQATAFALMIAALLHQHLRDPERAQEAADACIAHTEEHGIAPHRAWSAIVRGWAVAEQGLPAEGIAQMRESLGVHRAMHLQVVFTYFLALFAETLARNRDTGEALGAVTEAFEVMRTTGQRMYEAELHRLKGELLLQVADGNAAEAEACFREALVIASRQQAKSLELRAAVSAARLWERQGKKNEARDVLAPIYDWFTEGFDTADLRDAKELLDALV